MKLFLIAISLSIFLSGCLKEDSVLPDPSGIKTGIIVPNSNWPTGCSFGIADSIFISPDPTDTLRLYARVSHSGTLDHDLKVSFAKDTALISKYNGGACGGGGFGGGGPLPIYELLPDSCYRIESLQLTIPKGTRQAYLPIVIFPDKINSGIYYMLAFTITDAQGEMVASNFKSMLFPMLKP